MSLYIHPVGFTLGWWPSIHVMPSTVQGVRVLALEAVRVGAMDVLDKLELHILKLLKIEPDDGLEVGEAVEVDRLFHEPGGIVIRWRVHKGGECPACLGSMELSARGHDYVSYDVECPRCEGTGNAIDAEERYVLTDIDGHNVREAA